MELAWSRKRIVPAIGENITVAPWALRSGDLSPAESVGRPMPPHDDTSAPAGLPGRRVAVVIAAYNVAHCISRAIQSVQAQTVGPAEIIVADDCSTDGTADLVSRLAESDPRIRLLPSERNSGPGAARNRAIESTDTDWIAVLDGDDAWKPRRLERLLEEATQGECAIIADNYTRLDDSSGLELGDAFYDARTVSPLTAKRFIASEHPLGRVRFGLLKPMVRRQFLLDRGIRYATEIGLAEDFHFFLRVLLEGGKGLLLNEAHYIYTLPQSPVSGSQSRGSRTRPNLMDRIWVANDLIQRYGKTQPPEVTTMLRRYRGWMSEIARGRLALEAWKTGHRWRAIWLAIARPRSAFSYAWTSPTIKRIRAGFEPKPFRAPL
jgi:succinoglycan biosynthesis protein ExoO